MFEGYDKKSRLRSPTWTEIVTIFGLALGVPAYFMWRNWRLGIDIKSAIAIMRLCFVGGLVALRFRISRAEDEI